MARHVSTSLDLARERFVTAGLRTLRDYGAGELTVRRVAELAETSTMGIYTAFGGRMGMLEAIYRRGMELLRDALADARSAEADLVERIYAQANAYRDFALDNLALYSLLFERPLFDFDPSPQARHEALELTFTPLVADFAQAQRDGIVAGDDPVRPAYLFWTIIHGMVSIELTHAARSQLPGWFLDSREAGHQVLVDGVAALLAGLRPARS